MIRRIWKRQDGLAHLRLSYKGLKKLATQHHADARTLMRLYMMERFLELVHHKKTISAGSTYDENNLMSLCIRCHEQIHKRKKKPS